MFSLWHFPYCFYAREVPHGLPFSLIFLVPLEITFIYSVMWRDKELADFTALNAEFNQLSRELVFFTSLSRLCVGILIWRPNTHGRWHKRSHVMHREATASSDRAGMAGFSEARIMSVGKSSLHIILTNLGTAILKNHLVSFTGWWTHQAWRGVNCLPESTWWKVHECSHFWMVHC